MEQIAHDMLKEARKKDEEESRKVKGKEKVLTPPQEVSLKVPVSPLFSFEKFEFTDQEEEIKRLKRENAQLKKENKALAAR